MCVCVCVCVRARVTVRPRGAACLAQGIFMCVRGEVACVCEGWGGMCVCQGWGGMCVCQAPLLITNYIYSLIISTLTLTPFTFLYLAINCRDVLITSAGVCDKLVCTTGG